MHRCALKRRAALTLMAATVSAGALFPGLAAAQLPRNFPQTALRGEIRFTAPPEITVNGDSARLSPGSRIRGLNNMLQMSGALTGEKYIVNYTIDSSGLVHEIWLLRDDEIANRPWPRSPEEAQRWIFDAAAQTWTKP
jgi:hypothetical protein